MYNRRKSKIVKVGAVAIGGGFPVSIESMTNTKTADVAATVAQIRRLAEAGCEIVRITVNNPAAAEGFRQIRRQIDIALPLVADIHFDHNMALAAIDAGADKIRINPGNIGSAERLAQVARTAKKRGIPIRVGVNAGSLEQGLIDKFGGVTAQGLAESALRNVRLLESLDFGDIIISMKASNIPMTLEAHEILAPQVEYPLHIGITEAGTLHSGTIKSVAGLASLLTRGIGDTLRISLTADPVEEVKLAKEMLQALRLRVFGPEIISCPTCGRTEIDLIPLVNEVTARIGHIKTPITIAIMGCAVNGPGEARQADIGIAAGKGEGLLFKKGEIVRKIPEAELADALVLEIEKIVETFSRL
ncbi:MAG: flavodoxin-dependent (E)-4-hydroxy-3-methylbut-2-enyl-diphosphate synthase [Clostridiales bacterium]|jgi:(E)-4-hydroxy-3-methylbut-2-enyl-diphosphate synthase|nr:flavodoxin-dependent (E)-4-hydroxy-3-methylbut-2-enyl-diphosphate synthase [Clostridiales bacterium]